MGIKPFTRYSDAPTTKKLLLRPELSLRRQLIQLGSFNEPREVLRIYSDDPPEPMAGNGSPRYPVVHRAFCDPDASCGISRFQQSSWFLLGHMFVGGQEE